MDIRDCLRDYIKEKGYRQSSIALKSNMTEAQFSAVLHKKRKLDANELFMICTVLSLTPEQLMEHAPKNTA